MKILVACEESQRVCAAFRKRDHEAYSCDLSACSGGHPEWHIKSDVIPILNGNVWFYTQDYRMHYINSRWDMIIAHPPCTFLTNAGTSCFSLKVHKPEYVCKRWEKRCAAVVFFMQCVLADCDKIAIENPIGIMNKLYRKPDQIIHPYMFEDDPESEEYVTKATCIWLKGLPMLISPKKHKINNGERFGFNINGKARNWTESIVHGSVNRSKTFFNIAEAMADSWG